MLESINTKIASAMPGITKLKIRSSANAEDLDSPRTDMLWIVGTCQLTKDSRPRLAD
jgi:hypothetical protein